MIPILNKQVIGSNDILEFSLKNDTTNISDFPERDSSHLLHFGSISGTKSSLHFFYLPIFLRYLGQNMIWYVQSASVICGIYGLKKGYNI